jgi:FtsP/CotA-like multicopper oxidase with cupredoxin domain
MVGPSDSRLGTVGSATLVAMIVVVTILAPVAGTVVLTSTDVTDDPVPVPEFDASTASDEDAGATEATESQDAQSAQDVADTIGYNHVSSFATPSWRNRSRSYSRQYDATDEQSEDSTTADQHSSDETDSHHGQDNKHSHGDADQHSHGDADQHSHGDADQHSHGDADAAIREDVGDTTEGKVIRRNRPERQVGERSMSMGPFQGPNSSFQLLESQTVDSCSGFDKEYDVSAIDVDIPLNKFGDHDPKGRMYTLDENIDDVREQERTGNVTAGLRDDPIQPLVIRANLGECVRINFTNRLDRTASMHLHRGFIQANQSGSNVGNNQNTMVAPGGSRTYEFKIPRDPQLEGTWYFHSHGDRTLANHGLFGALNVEPAGSTYLDPATREPTRSGWEAIIDSPDQPAFREFTIFYHTIGNDTYRPLDKDDGKIPLVDPKTDVYRPCTKALNYRSECFLRRMQQLDRPEVQDRNPVELDDSLGYSDYTFGQPATPIPQTYNGDPTKFRMVGGSSEVRHVHHQHGGGVRWRFQPDAGHHSDYMFRNLTKDPPDKQSESQRLDSQSLGPGETYNVEIACGGGGCQRGAGDFLFHCHVADHYVAGMWTYWRNYDTKQSGLAELPGRVGETPRPVNSTGLLGETLENGKTLTNANIDEWIQGELPPQGEPGTYDATVWNWARTNTSQGPVYLGEPDDELTWPNYEADNPGERPEIMFNPENGRPAFPMLKPHLGKRPPFARTHGPAPYLSSTPDNLNDLATNSDHERIRDDPRRETDQLCPDGSPIKRYNIVAIDKPHKFNPETDTATAEVYVLAKNKEAILSGERPTRPLVYRANVGDCVELTLTSELEDNEINHGRSKVNIHPHFVQFDPQASDGVITGGNFEQSVRNYRVEDTQLRTAAEAGVRTIEVQNASKGYHVNATIAVGLGTEDLEVHRIASIDRDADTITFEDPLVRDHSADTPVGAEFVRYRYFADANFGTVVFHDHVNAPLSFPRGLFGGLIIEPEGSSYHDPQTGEEIDSGPIADIHTGTDNRIADAANSAGESFREFAPLLTNDRHEDIGVGSWINMRAEPFDTRDGNGTVADRLSSITHGDPVTPILRAYEGDPVVFRSFSIGPNKPHTFRVTGHEFRLEHFEEALPQQAILAGASERFDLKIDDGAGEAGDYMYYVPQADHLSDGMWGIFRVLENRSEQLEPLPDQAAPPAGETFVERRTVTGDRPADPNGPGDPCPDGAPVETFDVTAMSADVTFNEDAGIEEDVSIFALDKHAEAIRDGERTPQPLVLRANAGDCLEVTVTNELDLPVTMQVGQTEYDPQRSGGVNVGYNFDQAAESGETRTYRVFVDEHFGAGLVTDFGVKGDLEGDDYRADNMYGLYGAIVTAPEGATFHDPRTGEEVQSGWNVVVDTGTDAYRDYVLAWQEHDPIIGSHQMPYREDVHEGISAINYRAEPFEDRLDSNENRSKIYSSKEHGDPATPLLEAYPGDDVRIHNVYGFGFQNGLFSIQGHNWELTPRVEDSTLVSDRGTGPGMVINARLAGGANAPGDYLYQNHRLPYTEDGMWGIFRIYETDGSDLLPLSEFDGED